MKQSSTEIRRYPRTPHLTGSAIQIGDEDLKKYSLGVLHGKNIIIEEKVDGASAGISYDDDWNQLLQSRGHYLTGGPREKHFNLFKQWGNFLSEQLLEVLTDRYVLYGEWMFAKHTEFYDLLPHYFLEFDVLDTQKGTFIDGNGIECNGSWLSTARRKEILKGLPIESVFVLYEGKIESIDQLKSMITKSKFKSENWKEFFFNYFPKYNPKTEEVLAGTDMTDLMEGLYIKVEEDGVVKERYKFVRSEFVQQILMSDNHWLDRPIIPNVLASGVDIFKL